MKKVDRIKHPTGDIKQKGFGIIPKLVMQDTRLSVEAKAIYAYMASYAGAGDTAFPGVDLMIHHLGVSKKRFYRHRDDLEKLGYIQITKSRKGNRNASNVYELVQKLDFDSSHFDQYQNEQYQNEQYQNDPPNSNSNKINSLNNNSPENHHHQKGDDDEEAPKGLVLDKELGELARLYQECIGQANSRTAFWLEEILKEYGFLWCKNALIRADEYGGRTKAYVRSILDTWKANGGMKLEVKSDGGNSESNKRTSKESGKSGISAEDAGVISL